MRKLIVVVIVGLVIAGGLLTVWSRRANAPSTPGQQTQRTKPTDTTNKSTTAFDKAQYSTTDPASPWVVVNKQHPLNPRDYAPTDLENVGNGQSMRAEAATALKKFFADAQTAGYTLTAASGYRSYSTQVGVYNNEVATNGQATADSQSARPGYSEHQTGWAIDIAGGGCSIDDCFGDRPEGKWAAANAWRYGFLLRYTPSDTAVTGYRAEAWHFRYIGTLLSTELHNQGITTLEAFFNITGGPTYN